MSHEKKTVEGRLEGRLWQNLQYLIVNLNLEVNSGVNRQKILQVLAFYLINFNMNEILIIFDNIDNTKRTGDMMEMPGLGYFCDYCLKNTTLKSRLSTVMFRGTPYIKTLKVTFEKI